MIFFFREKMVCEKCEKKGKLGKVINPDPWKAGSSNNTTPGASAGSRKVIFVLGVFLTFCNHRFCAGWREQATDIEEKSFQSCWLGLQKVQNLQAEGKTSVTDFALLWDGCSFLWPFFLLQVHQVNSHYCQECAYKKGICAMCGHKIIDTSKYRQSSVWAWSLIYCTCTTEIFWKTCLMM